MTRILAIRHPEYTRTGDSWAAPLTTAGLDHAQRIATWVLERTREDSRDPRVLHSVAKRSRQLAEKIGLACRVEIEQAAWLFRGPGSIADLLDACLGESTVVLATHLDCIMALLALAGKDASNIEYGEIIVFNFDPEDRRLELVEKWEV